MAADIAVQVELANRRFEPPAPIMHSPGLNPSRPGTSRQDSAVI
jgi:hypothetical protein